MSSGGGETAGWSALANRGSQTAMIIAGVFVAFLGCDRRRFRGCCGVRSRRRVSTINSFNLRFRSAFVQLPGLPCLPWCSLGQAGGGRVTAPGYGALYALCRFREQLTASRVSFARDVSRNTAARRSFSRTMVSVALRKN